jgi:hypothetical protein
MATILEGWCRIDSTSKSFWSYVTAFSGDYVSERLCLYVFSVYTYTVAYRIQRYANGEWRTTRPSIFDVLPHSFPLYLVRASDFSESSYSGATYETAVEELSLGKYICNIESLGVNYYWTPVATPLSTPTGLYADNITSDSARIGWNAVENAVDYKVEYRRQGDTTWNE